MNLLLGLNMRLNSRKLFYLVSKYYCIYKCTGSKISEKDQVWKYVRLFSPCSLICIDITASEVSKYSEKLGTSCSCVIKTIEPRASATVDDLKNVVLRISILEEERNISHWDDEQIPEEIVCSKPNSG